MQLSVVDAQDLYMSAKAFTSLTISELEAEWHKPAIEKMARVLAAMTKQQKPGQLAMQMPGMNEQLSVGGGYGSQQQNIV